MNKPMNKISAKLVKSLMQIAFSIYELYLHNRLKVIKSVKISFLSLLIS